MLRAVRPLNQDRHINPSFLITATDIDENMVAALRFDMIEPLGFNQPPIPLAGLDLCPHQECASFIEPGVPPNISNTTDILTIITFVITTVSGLFSLNQGQKDLKLFSWCFAWSVAWCFGG